MKLLFLTAYSAPELTPSSYLGDNRNKALVANGCEIIIYTPVPTRGVSDEVRSQYMHQKRHEYLAEEKTTTEDILVDTRTLYKGEKKIEKGLEIIIKEKNDIGQDK